MQGEKSPVICGFSGGTDFLPTSGIFFYFASFRCALCEGHKAIGNKSMTESHFQHTARKEGFDKSSLSTLEYSDRARRILGNRLKTWRSQNGWPLKRVADEFGVSVSTWHRWEQGGRFPSADLLPLLSNYLNIPICRLFYEGVDACPACLLSKADQCRVVDKAVLTECQKS
jgi:DNA-binding transcriptional regulator YiaG